MSLPARKAPPPGLHRIAAVARATGVTEHALRIWERRYGVISSHRSPAGYRLYNESDISRISAIKELLELGFSVGEVARLTPGELQHLRERSRGPKGVRPEGPFLESMRERFLAAIERFDLEAANRIAAACAQALSAYELVSEVAGPLLTEVGVRWQDKRFTIAQEHAATAVWRSQLSEVIRAARPASHALTIVATTPTGELHELGALIAAVIAASAGARVIYLGPNTPAPELADAARSARAQVVLLSMVCLEERAATEELRALQRVLDEGIAIWVGGASIQHPPPEGIVWVRTLDELRTRAKSRL